MNTDELLESRIRRVFNSVADIPVSTEITILPRVGPRRKYCIRPVVVAAVLFLAAAIIGTFLFASPLHGGKANTKQAAVRVPRRSVVATSLPPVSRTSVAASTPSGAAVSTVPPPPGATGRETGWSVPQSTGLPGSAQAAISCLSASFCAAGSDAGGPSGYLTTYNGTTWSDPTAVASAIQSISCVAPSFCMAMGGTDFLIYNGTAWTAPSNFGGASSVNSENSVDSVSCPSPSFCAAVGWYVTESTTTSYAGYGYADIYDGTSWSAPINLNTDSGGSSFAVGSVSCSSSSFCLATAGDYYFVYSDNNWTTYATPDDLGQVSCATESFCISVNDPGDSYTYDGSAWSAPKDIDGSDLLSSVSCPVASFCAAVDGEGYALAFNGRAWSAPSVIDGGGGGDPLSVSCPSASFCAVLDLAGRVITYRNTD